LSEIALESTFTFGRGLGLD
jgi:hypothetical protein